jgi:transcriptional regulator with XRE-family HTH domain
MNITQCKMARAGLGWTRETLADVSGVSVRAIAKFEDRLAVLPETVRKLRAAFENAGVVFIERGVHIGGVVPPVESD